MRSFAVIQEEKKCNVLHFGVYFCFFYGRGDRYINSINLTSGGTRVRVVSARAEEDVENKYLCLRFLVQYDTI